MARQSGWWVIAALFLLIGCRREEVGTPAPRKGWNVLLITIDTQRPDRLSCYGYKQHQTPAFDRLAREGVRFANAFCDVTWTTPSMSSVMTGSYPTRHGLRSTYQRLAAENITLAEVLKANGYATAAIVGSFPVAAMFGLDQGFDHYDDRFSAPIVVGAPTQPARVENKFHENVDDQRLFQMLKARADAYRPDAEVTDTAIQWLDQNRPKDQPFFLWLHYFGPHELQDLRLSPEEQNVQILKEYDGQVRETDRQLGRLLAALDQRRLTGNTLTILHADHGQSLGEHWYVGHGRNLYDPTLRIPLLVRLPGVVPAGKVVEALARNIDIFPTVLDLTGIRINHAIDGETLRVLWEADGKQAPAERELYCETYMPAMSAFAQKVTFEGQQVALPFRRRGVRTSQWKYVINEPWPMLDFSNPPPIPPALAERERSEELYDLRSNPLELAKHRVTDRPDLLATFRERVEEYARTTAAPSQRRELDEAAKERLRSLGYEH